MSAPSIRIVGEPRISGSRASSSVATAIIWKGRGVRVWALAASDVARAKDWYAEKLGLEPTFEWPGGLMYPAGGHPMGFGVYLSPNAGTNRATSAAWMVHDLDRVMSELRQRGVKFEDYDMPELLTVDGIGTSADGSRSAWFIDSEGNTLMILQPTEMAAPLTTEAGA